MTKVADNTRVSSTHVHNIGFQSKDSSEFVIASGIVCFHGSH